MNVEANILRTRSNNQGSNSCSALLSIERSQAKTFYRNFTSAHDAAREIVRKHIQPICDAIVAFIDDVKNKLQNDPNARAARVKNFTEGFDDEADYAIGLFVTLLDDVDTLEKLGNNFAKTQNLNRKAGSSTNKCEADRNEIQSINKAFLDALPGLADEARGLLVKLLQSALQLKAIVKNFVSTQPLTSEDQEDQADQAQTQNEINIFINTFEIKHNETEESYDEFKELCDNVNDTLIKINGELESNN